MKRPLRRRKLLMVLLLLTGGAIINVAVAWGCGYAAAFDAEVAETYAAPMEKIVGGTWARSSTAERRRGCGIERLALSEGFIYHPDGEHLSDSRSTRLPHWTSEYITNRWGTAAWANTSVLEFAQGLPLRTLTCQLDQKGLHDGFELANSMRATGGFPKIGVLALNPYWPGFAINTTFYAATFWLLFTAHGFVRRRIRIHRKQCTACAYPVGTSNVCTECGAPRHRQPHRHHLFG